MAKGRTNKEVIGGIEYNKTVLYKVPKGAKVYEVRIIQSIEYYCSGAITCTSNVPGYELRGNYSSDVLRLINENYKRVEELINEDYTMDRRITIVKYIAR